MGTLKNSTSDLSEVFVVIDDLYINPGLFRWCRKNGFLLLLYDRTKRQFREVVSVTIEMAEEAITQPQVVLLDERLSA
jgi:hypothetical protein